MKRADAPPPGWYPAPTGGERLWWWDGLDWTDHHRVAPRAGRLAMVEEAAAAAKQAARAGSGERSTGRGAAPKVRTAARGAGVTREDTSAIVEEVRRATRSEIERATQGLTERATDARKQLEPLISEYGTKLVGWARRLVVVGLVLWVLYLATTAAIQGSLMDWLGDRVDNAVNGVMTSVPATRDALESPLVTST